MTEQQEKSKYIWSTMVVRPAVDEIRAARGEPFLQGMSKSAHPGGFDTAMLESLREAWFQPGTGEGSAPDALSAMTTVYCALVQTYAAWKADPEKFAWPSDQGYVHVPTLVVEATDDAYFVSELLAPTRDLCKAPNSDGKVCEGATHWMLWDDADLFSGIMIPYLRSGKIRRRATALPDGFAQLTDLALGTLLDVLDAGLTGLRLKAISDYNLIPRTTPFL